MATRDPAKAKRIRALMNKKDTEKEKLLKARESLKVLAAKIKHERTSK